MPPWGQWPTPTKIHIHLLCSEGEETIKARSNTQKIEPLKCIYLLLVYKRKDGITQQATRNFPDDSPSTKNQQKNKKPVK